MAKKITAVLLCALIAFLGFAGCSNNANQQGSGNDGSGEQANQTPARIGALKGPTSIGLASMSDNPKYDFKIYTAADEISALVMNGTIDIALVPSNVASILYSKTNGGIQAIDVNTLGVLYILTARQDITKLSDLSGKTVMMSGKGTVPDISLAYLLEKANVASVTIDYKSEPAEAVAGLKASPDAIAMLPQPFATVAESQVEGVKSVIDITKEWESLSKGQFVTGVTIARKEFIDQNPAIIAEFLTDHQASAAKASSDVAGVAQKVVSLGIIDNQQIAEKAIPKCNVTFVKGAEMKTALSGYLSALFEKDPNTVGGALPDDNFYFGI